MVVAAWSEWAEAVDVVDDGADDSAFGAQWAIGEVLGPGAFPAGVVAAGAGGSSLVVVAPFVGGAAAGFDEVGASGA